MHLVLIANGIVLVFASVLMGIDAALYPDTADVFGLSALLSLGVGGMIAMAARSRKSEFTRLHTFVLTTSAWITAAAAGALPMHLWGLTIADSFFEAMSGITTTGSTVMAGLDQTQHGILFWRALLQWVGGVGIIVTGIAILPILNVGGMQLFRTESSERGEKELGSAANFATATLWVYGGLTLACVLAFIIGGMTPFDAVTHAMTSLSTGGYSTHDLSMGYFDSGFIEWSATFFMLCGSLPFAWYIRAFVRGRISSEQIRSYLLGLAVVILGLTGWRVATADVDVLVALRHVAFNVVSVVTTTGFASTDYTTWGATAVVAFFLLTSIGGCTGSTAGGIKAMRLVVSVKLLYAYFRSVSHPNGIFVASYEGEPLEPSIQDGVSGFFIMFIATAVMLSIALSLVGLDMQTAISGALTALANVGPGIGNVIGPAGNFSTLPDIAKWILSFGMLLGRLEVMTVLVLFTPAFWRR